MESEGEEIIEKSKEREAKNRMFSMLLLARKKLN